MTPNRGTADVVVVGGGIGGATLATALARAGLGVAVLEATTEFPDRVRGESMHAWGVMEARELGVEDVLLAAGAHISSEWRQYQEGIGEVGAIPMNLMVEGIPGTLNLRHPVACQALLDAAEAAGAAITRGVDHIQLTATPPATVTYSNGDGEREIRTSLVIGADGRNSAVRRQIGVTLEREDPITYIAGLLVDGLDDVPDDFDVIVGEGDVFFVLFHQGGGRARVYIVPGLSDRHRFSGPAGTQQFLAACALDSYPWSDRVAGATPAGPCKTYPGDDTWTETPYVDGAVLIGDAAGHNDPIAGEGLSIALRDARIVRDLVLDGARTADAFAPYGRERMERMERLRFGADIIAVTHAEDADNRAARRAMVGQMMAEMDPQLFPLLTSLFTGPENMPPELVDGSLLDRIRAA